MSNRYRDICDQNRKLSKIEPNFGRFFSHKFCWGQKLYTHYYVYLAARQVEKFREVIPTSPKVIKL